MSVRSYRRRRSRQALKRQRARRRRRWPWFGLGALLIAVAAMFRREPRAIAPAELPEPPVPPPPPIDLDSSWITGPAGTVHVLERHPDGRLPVLFVHGLGGCAEHWTPQLEAAGPALRAIAFDLPGHGRSDPAADDDYSISAAAATIGAVADALSLRRMVLVAHSLGANAAIEYAAARRRRVAGLLLVDPSGDQTQLPQQHRRQLLDQLSRNPEEEIPWYFRQLLAGARPEVADRVLEDLEAVSPEIILSALENGSSHSPLPALDRFDGPIKSLISDLNDLPYSLHHLVPELPTVHVPQSGHWLMMDRPDDLWTVLIELLDEIESRA